MRSVSLHSWVFYFSLPDVGVTGCTTIPSSRPLDLEWLKIMYIRWVPQCFCAWCVFSYWAYKMSEMCVWINVNKILIACAWYSHALECLGQIKICNIGSCPDDLDSEGDCCQAWLVGLVPWTYMVETKPTPTDCLLSSPCIPQHHPCMCEYTH